MPIDVSDCVFSIDPTLAFISYITSDINISFSTDFLFAK